MERGRFVERSHRRPEAARVERREPSLDTPTLSSSRSGCSLSARSTSRRNSTTSSMVKFTLALGGAVVLLYVFSRWVYRYRAIAFPGAGAAGGSGGSGSGSARIGARLADPAVLLHHVGGLSELAGREHSCNHCAALRRRGCGGDPGTSFFHLRRVRPAASALRRFVRERPAGDGVRLVPLGNSATAPGPLLTIPFALPAGGDLRSHSVARRRGHRASAVRRRRLSAPGPRA